MLVVVVVVFEKPAPLPRPFSSFLDFFLVGVGCSEWVVLRAGHRLDIMSRAGFWGVAGLIISPVVCTYVCMYVCSSLQHFIYERGGRIYYCRYKQALAKDQACWRRGSPGLRKLCDGLGSLQAGRRSRGWTCRNPSLGWLWLGGDRRDFGYGLVECVLDCMCTITVRRPGTAAGYGGVDSDETALLPGHE